MDKAVSKGRANEAWRTQYMKERIIIYDAIREEQERAERAEKRAEKAEKRIADLEAQLAPK